MKNGGMAVIIEFLEARVAEDEAAAAELGEIGPGHQAIGTRLEVSPFTAARVLAECAAKRKILGNVPLVADIPSQMGGTSQYVLMCLASEYSWHPEYEEGCSISD